MTHGVADRAEHRIGQARHPVVHPQAVAPRLDEPGATQIREVPRRFRLRNLQALVDVADAYLARQQEAENAHAHAGEIGDREKDRQQRDGRAEIGLLGDQQERKHGETTANREVAPARGAAVLAEELGEHESDTDLGEFRWLQVDGFEGNPAPGAHHDRSEEQHVDEQRQHGDVDQMRFVSERSIVHAQGDDHRHQADDDGVELRLVHVRGRPGRIRGRAVDHRDAEPAERKDGQQQGPVDVVVEASFEHG